MFARQLPDDGGEDAGLEVDAEQRNLDDSGVADQDTEPRLENDDAEVTAVARAAPVDETAPPVGGSAAAVETGT